MDLIGRTQNFTSPEPTISASVQLNFLGDWGQANFHRICSWLTQEFCDRAGPCSQTSIRSLRNGGLEALTAVYNGEAHLSIATPAHLLPAALTGEGIFNSTGPMPSLRALAILPQLDRMMFAIHPKYGVKSWDDLHRLKPALRIATSYDDGTNFIGYVAMRLLEAHGLSKEVLESWGGSFVLSKRPEQAIENVRLGNADSIVQEAIMTPWWRNLMENLKYVPIPINPGALERLADKKGFEPVSIRAGFWSTIEEEILAAEFSDFVIVVRDDLPDEIAYLLTWILVNTREVIESQYKYIPSERSPLTYPLDPVAMAKTSLPLHPAAEKFYRESGYLQAMD